MIRNAYVADGGLLIDLGLEILENALVDHRGEVSGGVGGTKSEKMGGLQGAGRSELRQFSLTVDMYVTKHIESLYNKRSSWLAFDSRGLPGRAVCICHRPQTRNSTQRDIYFRLS